MTKLPFFDAKWPQLCLDLLRKALEISLNPARFYAENMTLAGLTAQFAVR